MDNYPKLDAEILAHHGILGQKWGTRNGPPYPLGGGDYTEREKNKIYKARRHPNSIYNKKHFDTVLKADKTKLTTLSYDKDRTKNTDMFFAAHKTLDKHQYNALFNQRIPKTIYDESGNAIGTGLFFKYRINNRLANDIKVASEDSGAEVFRQLYKKDRDFYNFVTDPKRMMSHYPSWKYVWKGYREAMDVINKMNSDPSFKPTSRDLQMVYRLFNYTLPSDGAGNARAGADVYKQRAKFFKAMKDAGYGAILDTNDAIYGGFKASSPVIVIDMEAVILDSISDVSLTDKNISQLITSGRKILGV